MAYGWEFLSRDDKASILAGIESGQPRVGPHVVELSWQDRCNIDCFFCSTSELRAGNSQLSSEAVLRVFDEISALGGRSIRLMGGGEPLFRKDTPALLGELAARGLEVADVTTNGVLLTEPVIRALYLARCAEITVSLNTADPTTYAAMMQTTGANFGRVVDNVRLAARIKQETGSDCRIRLQFLIYKENYRLIPRMYEVFQASGADSFFFNGLYPVRAMPAMNLAEIDEMLRLYEGVLTKDLFQSLESFAFWELPVAERIAESNRRVYRGRSRSDARRPEGSPSLRLRAKAEGGGDEPA